jgi:hypothetical protein
VRRAEERTVRVDRALTEVHTDAIDTDRADGTVRIGFALARELTDAVEANLRQLTVLVIGARIGTLAVVTDLALGAILFNLTGGIMLAAACGANLTVRAIRIDDTIGLGTTDSVDAKLSDAALSGVRARDGLGAERPDADPVAGTILVARAPLHQGRATATGQQHGHCEHHPEDTKPCQLSKHHHPSALVTNVKLPVSTGQNSTAATQKEIPAL